MKELFDKEIAFLNQEAKRFSDRFPEQAERLNLLSISDRDPYVEQLIQGMAFLIANAKNKIESISPSLAGQLVQQVAPVFARPYPSCCIVEFSLQNEYKKYGLLRRGQKITARNVGPDKISCHYTLTRDLNLLPLQFSGIVEGGVYSEHCEFVLCFEKSKSIEWKDLDFRSLVVYINSPGSMKYKVWDMLTDSTSECELLLEGVQPNPAVRFKSIELNSHSEMLFFKNLPGFSGGFLTDFFCFRDSLFYLELNIDSDFLKDVSKDYFELSVRVRSDLFSGISLSDMDFSLNTSPAINLFESDAEPIRADSKNDGYLIDVHRFYSGHASVYSVNSVSARNVKTGQKNSYRRLHSGHKKNSNDGVFYVNYCKHADGRDKAELIVARDSTREPEILSLEVYATNGNYARDYIYLGDIDEVRNANFPSLRVVNITRPSPVYSEHLSGSREWLFTSVLNSSISGVSTLDGLKSVLDVFNFRKDASSYIFSNSLISMSKELEQVFERGVLVNRIAYNFVVDDGLYDSVSDTKHFCYILHCFLSAKTALSEEVRTVFHLVRSMIDFDWVS